MTDKMSECSRCGHGFVHFDLPKAKLCINCAFAEIDRLKAENAHERKATEAVRAFGRIKDARIAELEKTQCRPAENHCHTSGDCEKYIAELEAELKQKDEQITQLKVCAHCSKCSFACTEKDAPQKPTCDNCDQSWPHCFPWRVPCSNWKPKPSEKPEPGKEEVGAYNGGGVGATPPNGPTNASPETPASRKKPKTVNK